MWRTYHHVRWLRVGLAKASEWVMRGNVWTAKDAEGTGLFNHIVPKVVLNEYFC